MGRVPEGNARASTTSPCRRHLGLQTLAAVDLGWACGSIAGGSKPRALCNKDCPDTVLTANASNDQAEAHAAIYARAGDPRRPPAGAVRQFADLPAGAQGGRRLQDPQISAASRTLGWRWRSRAEWRPFVYLVRCRDGKLLRRIDAESREERVGAHNLGHFVRLHSRGAQWRWYFTRNSTGTPTLSPPNGR